MNKPRGDNSKAYAVQRLERRIRHARAVVRAKRRSTRPGDLLILETHRQHLEAAQRALRELEGNG